MKKEQVIGFIIGFIVGLILCLLVDLASSGEIFDWFGEPKYGGMIMFMYIFFMFIFGSIGGSMSE